MSKQRTIEANGQKLALYLPDQSWGSGLNFLTEAEDFLQVGLWGYDKNTRLGPHIHNEVPRVASKTQEMIFVKTGRVAASIFDSDNNLIEKLDLVEGDTLILFAGGHAYEVLEDHTKVLEVKNGPYPGPEADRRQFPWKD